jgi:DNA-binding LacI/PurR family transcriptional regulator
LECYPFLDRPWPHQLVGRTNSHLSSSSGVTLRDIAKKLGIHHSTVGRALQNAPNISLARRKEIQNAARELGYQPNAMATILGHQRHAHQKRPISAEIAWINFWNKPADLRKYLEFDLYWKGASMRAEQNGYRLEEFNCGNLLSPSRLERILLARNIHGILIPPHGLKAQLTPEWSKIDWGKFSTVRFGYSVNFPCTHLVTSNHLTSGMLAIENMWRLGYKRIGFAASPELHLNFRAGFLLKQMHRGGEQIPIFTVPSNTDPWTQLSPFSHWVKKNHPDAILTDFPQTHGMLGKIGYRVPEDIGLAATSILDGNADAGIDQHSEAIGRAAIETLISQLNHNEYGLPDVVREVLITGEWVDGNSLPAL